MKKIIIGQIGNKIIIAEITKTGLVRYKERTAKKKKHTKGQPQPPLLEPWFKKDMPLCSLRVRGMWDKKYIFSVLKGKQYIRRASAYDLQPKEQLEPFQPRFARAVAAWKTCNAETKKALHSRASKLGLQYSGYNYFISLFLLRKTAIQKYYNGSLD